MGLVADLKSPSRLVIVDGAVPGGVDEFKEGIKAGTAGQSAQSRCITITICSLCRWENGLAVDASQINPM